MVMLGDILAAARNAAGTVESWLEAADPQLSSQLGSAAGKEGLSVSAFVRAAVADFSRFASEEDWATLTSSLRDSEDPGTTCLLAMIHWRLMASVCSVHSPQRAHQPEGAANERSVQRPA